MVISLVQSGSYGTGTSSSGSSGTITLGASPTAGNYLIGAYTHWYKLTPTIPTGFTKLGAYETTYGGQLGITWFYKVATGSEGTSIAVGMSSSDDWGVSVEEWTGVAGIESYANYSENNGSVGTLVSASVIPSHLSDQFICVFAQQGGAVNGETNSLSTGWTIDQSPASRYNEGVMGHRNSLTTDTVTAITVTDTYYINNTDTGSALMVLYPAGGTTPNAGQFFPFF